MPSPSRLQNLPADWQCPTCGAEKKLFVSKQRQLAGFAENQVRLGGWRSEACCLPRLRCACLPSSGRPLKRRGLLCNAVLSPCRATGWAPTR